MKGWAGAYRRASPRQRALAWALACGGGLALPILFRLPSITADASYAVRLSLGLVALTFLLSIAVIGAAPRPAEPDRPVPLRWALAYGLLPLAMFVTYWVAFPPALMTDDSYVQWEQILNN